MAGAGSALSRYACMLQVELVATTDDERRAWDNLPDSLRSLSQRLLAGSAFDPARSRTNQLKTQVDQELRTFVLRNYRFKAEDCVDVVLINPQLPKNFDATRNEVRPPGHAKWWHQPYIQTVTVESWDAIYASRTDQHAESSRAEWVHNRVKWMAAWPSGTRFDVRCLDGGAWDRSTNWGGFATLEEALTRAGAGSGLKLPPRPTHA